MNFINAQIVKMNFGSLILIRNMKTIEERADEYIGYSYEKDEGYIVTSKRCAFINGAHSEHAELTRWHDPNEPPDNGRRVLLKVRDKLSSMESYTTGNYYDEKWHGCKVFFWNELISWREIHE